MMSSAEPAAPRPETRDGFKIAVVCALSEERTAVEDVMTRDYKDEDPPPQYGKSGPDVTVYGYGELGEQPTVLVCLADMGSLGAAEVVRDMRHSFANLSIVFLVGITGGAPFRADGTLSGVRLGDVIISNSMLKGDLGKQFEDRFDTTTAFDSRLPRAAAIVRAFLVSVQGGGNEFRRLSKRTNIDLTEHARLRATKYKYPGRSNDHIYASNHRHKHHRSDDCESQICVQHEDRACNVAEASRCDDLGCRPIVCAIDDTRDNPDDTKVHIGPYVSTDGVMKSAQRRDELVQRYDALGIEMEGPGVWSSVPTMVVKGVVDYADSHKNKVWRLYPAARAALCTKTIIELMDFGRLHVATEASQTQRAEESTPRAHNLPFDENQHFVGRLGELEALEKKFFGQHYRRRVALVGLGGIGKTQLALTFAYSMWKKQAGFSVFWVPAISVESIEKAFEEIAKMLGLILQLEDRKSARKLVCMHLTSAAAGRWLLVIDNADDEDILSGSRGMDGLLTCLPRSEQGLTLFTTRNYKMAQSLAGVDMVVVGRPSNEDALSILREVVVDEESQEDHTAISELLAELDNLPLAITQAAAYINVNGISISDYLDIIQSTEQDVIEVMSTEIGDHTRYGQAKSAVATTWIVSFQQIVEKDPDAAELLRYISCIEWKAIPESILPRAGSKTRMTSAVGLLCSYSFLVKRRNEKTYDMHRLVHLATRIWDKRYGNRAETERKGIMHLSSIFPFGEYKNRERWRAYLPHVASIRDTTVGQNKEGRGELYKYVGYCLQVDGKAREAVSWLEASCACYEDVREDDPDRLASQHELAGAYRANGQVEEAVELLEHVVAVGKKVLARDHPDRLASQHELAGAYKANGQVEEAVELLEHVVAVGKKVLAEDHPDRLASQHALAGAYKANGQVEEAVELLEHVVAVRKKVQAEDHPDRLASQHALAGAYQANGQVEEAVELLEYVVAVKKKVLTEDHPSRLASQHELAGAYQANGQVEEAVELLEHVVAIKQGKLRTDHPSRLVSEQMLAKWYAEDGRMGGEADTSKHVSPTGVHLSTKSRVHSIENEGLSNASGQNSEGASHRAASQRVLRLVNRFRNGH